MTDYAKERRAYVSQVRSSFGQDMDEMQARMPRRTQGLEQEQRGRGSLWMRVRFCAAIFLFLLFFCWQDSGKELCGMTPAKMIDMIQDNRYDTILQEYDIVLKDAIHTDIE